VSNGHRRTADGTTLRWRATSNARTAGVIPFLINWGNTPHPAASAPSGLHLESLRIEHPDPESVGPHCEHSGPQLPSSGDRAALVAHIIGPTGGGTLRYHRAGVSVLPARHRLPRDRCAPPGGQVYERTAARSCPISRTGTGLLRDDDRTVAQFDGGALAPSRTGHLKICRSARKSVETVVGFLVESVPDLGQTLGRIGSLGSPLSLSCPTVPQLHSNAGDRNRAGSRPAHSRA
jgi:hypothetical protein